MTLGDLDSRSARRNEGHRDHWWAKQWGAMGLGAGHFKLLLASGLELMALKRSGMQKLSDMMLGHHRPFGMKTFASQVL